MPKKKPANKKELADAMKDAQKRGFGIYDAERHLCINPESLFFFWGDKKREAKPMDEVVLLRSLMKLKNIYKEKFGNDSPYDLELFESNPAEFVERMIRAVEICTLNYVLQTGEGSLNTCPRLSMVKGKRSFLWEH